MENQHNNSLQDWEVALRQDVTQHEFSYDPYAWGGMEQLLELSNLPATQLPATVAISTTKLIAIIGLGLLLNSLVLGVILFQYEARKEEQQEQNIPVLEQKEEHLAEQTHEKETVGSTISSHKNKVVEIIEVALNETVIQEDEIILPQIKKNEQKRLIPSAVFLYRTETIPLLKTTAPLLDTSLMKVRLLKRKRNRKTLFPDVIE